MVKRAFYAPVMKFDANFEPLKEGLSYFQYAFLVMKNLRSYQKCLPSNINWPLIYISKKKKEDLTFAITFEPLELGLSYTCI